MALGHVEKTPDFVFLGWKDAKFSENTLQSISVIACKAMYFGERITSFSVTHVLTGVSRSSIRYKIRLMSGA